MAGLHTVDAQRASGGVTAVALRAAVADVPEDAGWARHRAACAALDALAPAPGSVPDALRVRVALAASFTIEPFVPFLRVELARLGWWADVYVAPYGQAIRELSDPASGLYAFAPEVTIVAIGTDVLEDIRAASPEADGEVVAAALLEPLERGLAAFAESGSGIVVVNDFPRLRGGADGALGFREPRTLHRALAAANARLRTRLAEAAGAYLFDLSDRVAALGRERAFNWRTYYRGHVLWSDALMARVARGYAGYAAAVRGGATKCIVLDLDNTLWGGVLGEEGAHGIAVGPQWPGREYLEFQRQLLDLEAQGILLAVCSKNDEEEVLELLRSHPDMLIRESHLAARRIDWSDKASNIRAIASELDIALEHMMFVDDMPHERAWVRERIPELVVPDLPDDPARYADWIAGLPTLTVLQRTAEDASRTRQYQEQRAREAFAAEVGAGAGGDVGGGALGADPSGAEAFLRRLDLRVEIALASEQTLPRVAQLLGKTNQFNLTTRRHDELTLRRNAERGRWRVYAMRVADRFGDFGLTGVAIAEVGREAWHLESFLMSCRVIGKSAESALVARIALDARAAGARRLTAEFIPTAKNAPARDLLPRHGFTPSAGERFVLDLEGEIPVWPEWITDVSPAPAAATRSSAAAGRAASGSSAPMVRGASAASGAAAVPDASAAR